MLRAPQHCNVGTAWMLGLIDEQRQPVDKRTGLHRHRLMAVAYQRRLVLFNDWQQTAYVLLLLVLNQGVLLILKLFAGDPLPGWSYFLPSVTGILLWQVVVYSRVRMTGVKD